MVATFLTSGLIIKSTRSPYSNVQAHINEADIYVACLAIEGSDCNIRQA